MKLAFSAPVPDDAQRRRLFEHLAPLGYAGVQLKGGDWRPFVDTPAKFLETWPMLKGRISGAIDGGRLEPDSIRKTVRFLSSVGGDLLIYCHGVPRDSVTTDDLKGFAKTLEQLGREARDQGVKLSLHHHFNQPCMHRPDFDLYFDRTRSQSYGLTIDTAHLVKSGIDDVAGVIRDFRHAIDNFHMKDFADGQWRVLGEGQIDFEPVFQAIRDIGYTGWVSADEESGGDVVDGMTKCAAFLKTIETRSDEATK